MFSPRNASLSDPLMLVNGNVPGNRVMELVPSTADKGQTIEWFYNEFPNIFEGKVPVMFGDSGGDETAMNEVLKRGGFAVGVGPKAPDVSNINLRNVDHAREFLTDLAEMRLNYDYAKDKSMKTKRFVI
jgi:trehalose-6-phosphatase